MDKQPSDRQSNSSVAIILAGGMIAAAIVFAAMHISNELQAGNHESRVAADVADESEAETETDEETALREEAVKQQLIEQLSSAGVELVELSNYRVTHNEKMIAFDLAYKTKDGGTQQSQQTCKDAELKEDDMGRYAGKLTLAGKAVAVVVY